MSGEKSKTSGEIGEALTKRLLEKLGWSNSLRNVPIKCSNSTHRNDAGNQRVSHGDDRVFLYKSPFHDDRNDVVHVSVKNHLGAYPAVGTARSTFKEHFDELQQIIDCARRSAGILDAVRLVGEHKEVMHSGLLMWFQNDLDDIETGILDKLIAARIEADASYPVFLVDNARASFLLKMLDDIERRTGSGDSQFYFPPEIGSSMEQKARPRGQYLPLELMCSDIVPVIISSESREELIVYADQTFSVDSAQKLMSYGIRFAREWVKDIKLGFKDFHPVEHQNDLSTAWMPFNSRKEEISGFSLERTILELLKVKGED